MSSACEACEDGLLLQFGGSIRGAGDAAAVSWTFLPLMVFLGWCFMGVALISDVFMGAIEKITSKKKKKWSSKHQRFVTVVVWNSTVSNLTLMALGSSAPEILLSVIETCGAGFFSDDLGPFTIVGSAAFNLLMIIAVCVVAIEDGSSRRIEEFGVYVLTAIWSLFAYFWILFAIEINTPNVVEIWEGVMTLLFFPMLVFSAYVVDRKFFMGDGEDDGLMLPDAEGMTKEELAGLETSIRQKHGAELSEDQVLKFLQVECTNQNHNSMLRHRIAATRAMTGGRRVNSKELAASSSDKGSRVVPVDANTLPGEIGKGKEKILVEFDIAKVAVLENAGHVTVGVSRHGDSAGTVTVTYKTREGKAKEGTGFKPAEGRLTFAPGETKQSITVEIIDDIAYEEDEDFFVDLSEPVVEAGASGTHDELPEIELGHKTLTVWIVDDDLPGTIGFPNSEVSIMEKVDDYDATFTVRRKNGSTGKVTCTYETEDDTAAAGQDFVKAAGTLVFEAGQLEAEIQVRIKGRGRYDRSEIFRLVLTDVEGGAKFDAEADGAPEQAILTIKIMSEQAANARVDRLMTGMRRNWEKAKVGHSNWADQFRDALFVNGGEDEDEDGDDEGESEGPSKLDWVMHIITVPWKLIFAFCPPTDYCGGWVCFICSLIFIGMCTAVIGDVANLMGCAMCVPKSITAITFVALGTSLPDTFASRTAAQQDPTADASIVNVTGSNSVNVFLGLGLPWMMASLYWRGNKTEKWEETFGLSAVTPPAFPIADSFRAEGAFIVKAGELGFSVIVFSVCAVIALGVLAWRRAFVGGELGGPKVPMYGSATLLVFLWCAFVGISSWNAMKIL